jgi:hypothetical protein
MDAISVAGRVNEKHQLFAVVPDSIPAGPVTVLLVPAMPEDDAGEAWMTGVAQAWGSDLGDVRQDIYTLADGEPVHES